MTSLKQFVQSISLRRVLTVFFAGVLLMISTACGRLNSPQASGQGAIHERRGQQTELYNTTQKREGGINQYKDTDSRLNTNAADAKARRLIDSAKRNVSQVNNPDEFVESFQSGKPLDERARDLSKDVGRAAENFAEDFSEGAQRGFRNLQKNTQNALDDAAQTIQQTTKGS